MRVHIICIMRILYKSFHVMMMMKMLLILKLLDQKVLNLKAAKCDGYRYGCSLSDLLGVYIDRF